MVVHMPSIVYYILYATYNLHGRKHRNLTYSCTVCSFTVLCAPSCVVRFYLEGSKKRGTGNSVSDLCDMYESQPTCDRKDLVFKGQGFSYSL